MSYVFVRGPLQARDHEKSEEPLYALRERLALDLPHYLLHQLREPVARVCRLFMSERDVADLFSGDHTRMVADDSTGGTLPGHMPADPSDATPPRSPAQSPIKAALSPAAKRGSPSKAGPTGGRGSPSKAGPIEGSSPSKTASTQPGVAGYFRAVAVDTAMCLGGCRTRIPAGAALCADCRPRVRRRPRSRRRMRAPRADKACRPRLTGPLRAARRSGHWAAAPSAGGAHKLAVACPAGATGSGGGGARGRVPALPT